MKGFLCAILILLLCLAGLSLLPNDISAATVFGLAASLSGALVFAVSVMALSGQRSRHG